MCKAADLASALISPCRCCCLGVSVLTFLLAAGWSTGPGAICAAADDLLGRVDIVQGKFRGSPVSLSNTRGRLVVQDEKCDNSSEASRWSESCANGHLKRDSVVIRGPRERRKRVCRRKDCAGRCTHNRAKVSTERREDLRLPGKVSHLCWNDLECSCLLLKHQLEEPVPRPRLSLSPLRARRPAELKKSPSSKQSGNREAT